MRVANLDMTDPNQNCPEGLRFIRRTEPPLRTCGRHAPGCLSTTFSSYEVEYLKVCGRIVAYQDIENFRCFQSIYPYNRALSIDDVYVDSLSLTHGQSPRQHIWTFANAICYVCPPAQDLTSPTLELYLPSLVKITSVKLEDGKRLVLISYSDDPLWDGQGCRGTRLAVSSKTHCGSASNSLNQLQMISS